MNIRDEVVLRELNLYPLWVLREGGAAGSGHPAASPCVNSVQPLAGNGLPDFVMRGLRGAPVAGSEGAATSTGSGQALAANGNRQQAGSYEAVMLEGGVADTQQPAPSVAQPILSEGNTPQLAMSIAAPRPSCADSLNWPELKQKVHDCTACKLRAGCTQTVFGVGDEKAEWLFVGEGPGADEDVQGEPFVGQAGKLLDNMLAAIKLKRGSNVYIANIVKCRPPNNRTPEPDEIATCLPYLQRQIALIQPKLIVALGKTAATSLLGREATLGSLRGTVHDFQLPATKQGGTQGQGSSQQSPLPHPPTSSHRVGTTTPLIVTYHPAYLLRSPAEKVKAWQDLCFAVQRMTE